MELDRRSERRPGVVYPCPVPPGVRGVRACTLTLLGALLGLSSPIVAAGPGTNATGTSSYVFDLGAHAPRGARYVRVDLPRNADLYSGLSGCGAWLPGAFGGLWCYSTSPETNGFHANFALEVYDVGAESLDSAAERYARDLPAALEARGLLVQIRPSKVRAAVSLTTGAGKVPGLAFDYTWRALGGASKSMRSTAQVWRLGDWMLVATAANVEDNEHGSLFFDGLRVGAAAPTKEILCSWRDDGDANRWYRVVHEMPAWPLQPRDVVRAGKGVVLPGTTYAPSAWEEGTLRLHIEGRAAPGTAEESLEALLADLSPQAKAAQGPPLRKAHADGVSLVHHLLGTGEGRAGLTTVGLFHGGYFVYQFVLERRTLFPEAHVLEDRKQVANWLASVTVRELRESGS